MKNSLRRTSIALVLLAILSGAAQAAEDGQLSLSPAVVTLRGDFGQSTEQRLTLRNGTSRPFSFDLVAQDVVVRNGKRAFAEAGAVAGSIAATAVFSPGHVDVPPGESVTVTATFTLPEGTQQRAVTALFRGTNRVMSGHVPIMASLGTLLTFTLSENVEMSASDLDIQTQTTIENLGFSHSCRNAGSEPLVARGVMAVLDREGALVGKTAIAPRRLLPGELADLTADFPGDLEPGRYRLLVTYDYEGRSLRRSAEVDIR